VRDRDPIRTTSDAVLIVRDLCHDLAAQGGGGNNDIPAQIAGLAKLKEQGILTNKEFKQKKAELLAKM